MENLTLQKRKNKTRTIVARAEKYNGTKTNGLPYLADEHRRLHPNRPRNWSSFQAAKLTSINEPGPLAETKMLEALAFERESRDARLFREALAAERISWGRGR